jgi:TrmH family RNA methyltransferase
MAEGVRLLEEALRHRFYPERVYRAESALGERGMQVVERFRSNGVSVKTVSARQLNMIADTVTPQGMVAVFDQPELMMAELSRKSDRKILLCENISDPGNLGTLFRSALAFGFGTVALIGRNAEPYSPKSVRSSVGAVFGLRVVAATYEQFDVLLEGLKPIVIAADKTGDAVKTCLKKLVTENNLILLIGSEAEGLTEKMINNADMRVRISHEAHVESLNAAIAGSILMSMIYGVQQ